MPSSTARSTTFCSSRTLPGQGYASSAAIASSVNPATWPARVFAKLVEKRLGQQRNVAPPLPQRRQLDVDHVDAVVQVLAEPARRRRPSVRSSFVARITRTSTLNVLLPPTCSNCSSCSTRSSFTCIAGLARADFVEEDRAAVGLHELADLVARGAGEGAGDVAEQLAFQQILGQGAAGDFDERLRRRRLRRWIARAIMLLPVPLSPVTSTVALRVGHAVDHVEHCRICGSWPTMLSRPERWSSCRRSCVFSSMHLPLGERPLDRHQQLVVDQRLGEVVERPGPHGFDGRVGVAVAGDQNHLALGVVAAHLLEQIEPVAVLQPHVDQQRSYALRLNRSTASAKLARRIDLQALAAEPVGHRFEHVAVVVDQQQ